MSLPAVSLDDLDWAALTAAARARIPAASGGRWTLHAPVDPGVTLLELYAALLEQRLYWMDQTPGAMLRGGLALLGEAPKDAAVAATVLHFPTGDRPVAAATAMQLQDSEPPVVFTTEGATRVLPLVSAGLRPRIDLRVGNREHGPDLQAAKPVCLFEDTDEVAVTLWLSSAVTPGADGTLLVLLDQPHVPPAWSAEAVDGIAPAARLTWFYAAPEDARAVLPDVQDGTLGLRRSGIVRFTVPADWTPGTPDAGALPFVLWVQAAENAYAAPPRLAGLWPNVAVARHVRELTPTRQLDWLRLPGQTIALQAGEMPPLAKGTRVQLQERTGWTWWDSVADLAFQGPSARVFTVDRARGVIRFGDGETGRIPVLATGGNAKLVLRAGGGTAGNVGVWCQWEPASDQTAPLAVNVVAGNGGAEPETSEQAQQRTAGALRRIERAVLATDYEVLTVGTPGVAIARAHAAVGFHPDFPCLPVPGVVTVFPVPWAPRDEACGVVPAPVPDPGAIEAVVARLEAARLVGSEVLVRPPIYVPVALTVVVRSSIAAPERLRDAITTRLARFLDPLVGGEIGQGWTFGEKLRPSALLRQAQDAAGLSGEVAEVAISLPGVAPAVVAESCRDVVIGAHSLPWLRHVAVRLTTPAQDAGGLT
jgi:predicted phage baseplate assembly protein